MSARAGTFPGGGLRCYSRAQPERTIAEAVKSALSQDGFSIQHPRRGQPLHGPNHLHSFRSRRATLEVEAHHPHETDLGIGGCWNEALRHEVCGRYAVQLIQTIFTAAPIPAADGR